MKTTLQFCNDVLTISNEEVNNANFVDILVLNKHDQEGREVTCNLQELYAALGAFEKLRLEEREELLMEKI